MMRRGLVVTVTVTLASVLSAAARPGVAPDSPWTCPSTSPIKGYLSEAGHRVYFLPGNPFYAEASPERCYTTEEEARRDGAGPTRDGAPELRGRDIA